MPQNEHTNPVIVVVDDDPRVTSTLQNLLRVETNYEVHAFASSVSALEFLRKHTVDLVISDYLMPEMDGISFLVQVRALQPTAPRVILTAYADKKNAIRAINEAGLFHYIEKPWDNDELLLVIRNGLENRELVEGLQKALRQIEELKNRLEAENIVLREEIKGDHNFEEIIGAAGSLVAVLWQVDQVAVTDATVLIHGETGTGKELIARAVHNRSRRRHRPLVKVNCAAIPANLIESELFGHEKGAFTGALNRKIGRFELADGGSIFLDEIGDMPLESQVKLLRVLQEGDFERLGNPETTHVDVRVVAATNRDLHAMIAAGRFREDLYYRLNVFPIHLPPLRDRMDDVSLLVKHFVSKFCSKIGRPIPRIPASTLLQLQSYHWPGNIRELENVIERSVITSTGNDLLLGNWLTGDKKTQNSASLLTMEELEKQHILKVLETTDWRVSGPKGAAEILGMKSPTLVSRMKKLGIQRYRSKT